MAVLFKVFIEGKGPVYFGDLHGGKTGAVRKAKVFIGILFKNFKGTFLEMGSNSQHLDYLTLFKMFPKENGHRMRNF